MSIWARPSANDNTSVRLPRKSLNQAAVNGRNAASVDCVSRPSVSSSRTRMPLDGSASGSMCVDKIFLAPTCTNQPRGELNGLDDAQTYGSQALNRATAECVGYELSIP